ncbi:MAG: amino acid permease C-terminal domain-containing protein, partial [Rhodomicrobium sp.]
LMGGLVPIQILGHMTSIGTLLAFIIVCVGVMVLRKTHPGLERGYRVPAVPLVPLAGIVVCLAMMVSLDIATWIRLVGWLLVGMVIYFGYSRTNARIARRAAIVKVE